MARDSAMALAQEIADIRRRLRHLERTESLSHSSIEDGALAAYVDEEQTMEIGRQFDGTNGASVLTGPVPPVPAPPLVTPVEGGVLVEWDGTYIDPVTGVPDPLVVPPMDWERVDIVATIATGAPLTPTWIGVTDTDYQPAALVGGTGALTDDDDETYALQWMSARSGVSNGPTAIVEFPPTVPVGRPEDWFRLRFEVVNANGGTGGSFVASVTVGGMEVGYFERDGSYLMEAPDPDTVYDWATGWTFVQSGSMTLDEAFEAGMQVRVRRDSEAADGDWGIRIYEMSVNAGGFVLPDFIAVPPVNAFVSPRGGEVFLKIPPVDVHIALVTRTTAGVASVPSEPVLDTPLVPYPDPTDGTPPATAAVVTPSPGIKAMHYEWTEVENADPVTYRLHVRAGDVPTTDGAYQVAAGVGLTAASAPNLTPGVTYHAVVTVEDDDGRGPDSAPVTGTPMLITQVDIADLTLTVKKFQTATHMIY